MSSATHNVMAAVNVELWKSQKRLSRQDTFDELTPQSKSGGDDDIGSAVNVLSDGSDNISSSKRFKRCDSLAQVEDSPVSSINRNCGKIGARRLLCLNGVSHLQRLTGDTNILSPITELANNLVGTNLNDTKLSVMNTNETATKVVENDGKNKAQEEVSVTPTSSINKSNNEKAQSKDENLENELLKNNEENHQNVNNDSNRRGNTSRRLLKMDISSVQDMVIDELSMYEDEARSGVQNQQQQHCNQLTGSPQSMIGLLSPEGSPQHFEIVETKSYLVQEKKRVQYGHHQNGNNSSSTTSSNTPAKGIRVFHSLSSSSMSSSIEDDYMELMEMETLEQQSGNAILNFPTGLNSLISGQIKSSSPSANNTISGISCFNATNSGSSVGGGIHSNTTPTMPMRRPAVRRCLSMADSIQPPKTPEFLKQVQETATQPTTFYSSRLTNAERSFSTTPNTHNFKRPDPPSNNNSPVLCKRIRSISGNNTTLNVSSDKENLDDSYTGLIQSQITTARSTTTSVIAQQQHTTISNLSTSNKNTTTTSVHPQLRKCMSMNDADILSALARSESKDEPDLIGDFSKPFVLPIMEGHHRDLKSISSDTVAKLLRGDFKDQVANYKIIDCRYPYEYEGGHIRGAVNLYTQEQIIQEFLTLQKTDDQQKKIVTAGSNQRNIIIFHCEFSSKRGPKLSRFLRNNDRARNTNSYPALDYPEIYLLHNGYKEFYETHSELCDPIAYRPMLEPSYSDAYRHFRAKSKSWNGDGLGGTTSRNPKKSRSRLML